jgi:hypothetical protein
MISPGWRCFELLSRALEPEERSAVRGDLMEAGVSSGRACQELLGLLARRQASLWKSWPPWIALLGIVYLILPLLIQCVAADGHMLIAYSMHLKQPAHFGWVLICGAILTFVWSWSSSFALAAISRRSIWINVPLFYTAGIMGVPYGLGGSEGVYSQLARNVNHHTLILTSQLALFLVPSACGLRFGMRTEKLRMFALLPMLAAIAVPIGILTLSAGWAPDACMDRLSAYSVLSLPAVYIGARTLRRGHVPAAQRL